MSHSSDDDDSDKPTALAQVMANILASSSAAKKKETQILSKVEKVDDTKTDKEKALLRMKREARRKRQVAKLAWERMGMVKPSIADKDRERNLAKIATKGVVQLFNAVAAQQDRLRSKISEEGTTDLKRTKIVDSLSRSSFIDLLKSQSQPGGLKSEKSDSLDNARQRVKGEKTTSKSSSNTEKPKWRILHDDFVMSEYAAGLPSENDTEQVKPEPNY